MRNTKRMLTLAGLTLATGAVLGMGATTASAATAQDSKTTVVQDGPRDGNGGRDGRDGRNGGQDGRDGRDGDRPGNWWSQGRNNNRGDRVWTVGRFPSKRSCNFAGWIGQHNHQWDQYICLPSRGGYILVVIDHHRNRRR